MTKIDKLIADNPSLVNERENIILDDCPEFYGLEGRASLCHLDDGCKRCWSEEASP